MKPVFRGDTWVVDVCDLRVNGDCVSMADLAVATVRATVAGFPASVAIDPECGVRLRLQVDAAITAQSTPSTSPQASDIEITFDDGRVATIPFSIVVRPDITI